MMMESIVIPAKAGISFKSSAKGQETPAFAGVTACGDRHD